MFETLSTARQLLVLIRHGALVLAFACLSIVGVSNAQTLQDCKGQSMSGNWECTPTPQIIGQWKYTVHVPGIASSDAADSFEDALPSLYIRLAAQTAVCGSATKPPDFIYQDLTWFEFHTLVSHTHWEHGQIRLAPLGAGCGSPQEFTAAVTMDLIRAPNCDVQKGWTSARVYDAGGVALSQFCMRPPKLDACPDGCPKGVRGNPVGLISGNKIIQETDYSTPGGFAFSRTYNSNNVGAQSKWTHNLYRRILRNHLTPPGTATTEQVWLHRGSSISYFLRVGGVLVPRAEQRDKLVETPSGYTYTGPDDTVETYGPDGTLLSSTSRDGRGFSLTYVVDTIANTKYANATDVFGRVTRINFVSASPITADENYWVSSIVTPMGSTISYEGWPNLARVVLEDGTSRRYFYSPAPGATTLPDPMVLTTVEDENAWTYAEYTYNTAGQVLTERHQSATGVYVNNYSFNPGLSYTDPLGTTRSYSTTLSAGASRITGYSQSCVTCGPDHGLSTTYDTNGNVASRADFNNKKVCYAYDLTRNLETTRVEGCCRRPKTEPLNDVMPIQN